ncbi:uncharacterized protein [Prorops nasuta]|uniref:uncharacterized protein n=1 Tax=Prorops nasuta TaxID=863751 RepID=UPI0034CEACB1
MRDYEIGLSNSLKIVYPNIKPTHCFFHFAQALMKKAKSLNIINRTKNKLTYPEYFIVIKNTIALALLPAKQIVQGLKKIGPDNVSVYKLKHRTNNKCENYHSVLSKRLGKAPHPTLFLIRIWYSSGKFYFHFHKICCVFTLYRPNQDVKLKS